MNNSTELYRHVNSAWVQNGRVSSQAFRPMPKDDKKLSVYNSEINTAKESFEHFTESLGYSAFGTMKITVADCISRSLPVIPDGDPFPGHAYIDFSAHSNGEIERKAKELKRVATWAYAPN